MEESPFWTDRPAVGYAIAGVRTAALLSGLLLAFVRGSGPLGAALVGLGIGYAAISFAADLSPRRPSRARRPRLLLDLLVLAILCALDGRGLETPLAHFLIVPILDAALRLDLEMVLGTGLLALVAAAGLAFRVAPTTAETALGAWAGMAVQVGLTTTCLALLVRDAASRQGRHAFRLRLDRQQIAFGRLASVMRRDVGFQELAEVVLDAAFEITAYRAATLSVLSDTGDRLEPVASRSRGPEPPANRVLPVAPDETVGEDDGVRMHRSLDHGGSVVELPLVGEGDRVVGRVTFLSPLPAGELDSDERAALVAFGEQAGAAWENAWLRRSLRQQSEDLNRSAGELSTLVEVSRALVALDQHEVLDQILGRAIALMAAERGSLMLLDPDRGELRIETARGLPAAIVESTRIRLGEGFAGRVAATGEGVRLIDTLEPGSARAGVRDALCVPLRVQDHIIGVLNISNKTGPGVFSERDLDFLSALANQAAISIQNARLFGEVRDLFLGTVSTLAKAVDAKDRYTAGHSHRVTLYALEIATRLGFTAEELDLLRIAGLMHDVGKIGVPEHILRKPGPLTATEREEMRRHPIYGARIVEPIRQLHPILPGVRWHHERFDGKGYPDALRGEDVPPQARVLMVADAFDAMTSDRPYRDALDDSVALAELREGCGGQWHPECVEAFLDAYDAGRIEPIKGSMPED